MLRSCVFSKVAYLVPLQRAGGVQAWLIWSEEWVKKNQGFSSPAVMPVHDSDIQRCTRISSKQARLSRDAHHYVHKVLSSL